ncbi:MAG: (Fe-S)-binding protein, partial [Planctomycetota bacterium]
MEGSAVLVSALTLGGLGLVFGILIALANSKLKVWEDPRLGSLTDLLPGTNCGAWGSPGCRGFAEALVEAKKQ